MKNKQWKKQLKAVRKLRKAFPLLEVATDEDGLLVICTNSNIVNEQDLWNEYLQVATCERI